MDIVLAAVPIIAEYTVAPVIRHASYPFKCKSNIEHRNKEVDELKKARERVQHSVDEEKRNGRKIHRDVKEWMLKADRIIEKVEGELAEDQGGARKRCFIGLCPNFKTRYQLSKKADKETMTVFELQKEREKFDAMSYRDAPDGMGSLSVKDYEALQSRMTIFKEIMDVLIVDDVNIIGVHGMGGVGKTTLVEQIVRQAKKDKLFNEVVMVVVTQNPDVKNIQEQIAEQLGLKFDEDSERVRADRLRERLKEEKKILVVLDDLWKKLDLVAVGIPYEDEHKGCKILLTSRELDVLSSGMDSQKNFSVGVLPEEEAWDLFKKMAGDNLENQDLQSTAIKVAKECAGLPVAIVTVSRALRNKSLSEWKNALRQLQRPSSRNFTGLQAVMYSTIELSYNHLESEELKLTFLLCSLMGYNATIRELLKYGLGLGLFPDIDTIEEAQDRVHSLVHQLRASCLLLDSDTGNQFAMHDVVRDVAISIASRDHHVFSKSNEVELKWPEKDTLKKCKQIWLHCKITELLEEMECLQLDLFRVESDDAHLKIPENFFKGMQGLQVLDLKNFSFSSLPSSLRLLENLQALCLDQLGLGDIAIVGELKNLEILSFIGSDMVHLPKEIGQLNKLRLLDLTDCSQLEVIPPNVISRLSLLEELYMGNSFDKWEIDRHNNQGQNNASLSELKQLSRLTNLEVHIQDAHVMPNNLFSHNLRRYRIFIGDVWEWKGAYDTLRTLKLKLNTKNHSEYGVQMLLKGAEDLYLHELKGVKNILYELDREGFPQLKHLHVSSNPEIQYIISAMQVIPSNAFPKLESFFLYNLASLEKICHGELRAQAFRKLRVIEVRRCHKLKNLFSFSVARGLLQLQSINIASCENMREIVAEESNVNVNKNEVIEVIEFTQLRSLSLKYLPQLRNFNEKIALPNLEELELNSINIEWHVQLPCIAFATQNLTRLVVYRCGNMKYLISSSMVKSLEQLKYLDVSDCNLMEEIIVTEELGEERMCKMLFPKLEFLQLSNLPKLTWFCTADLIEYPLLKRLSIQWCPQLKTFVSDFTNAKMTVSNEPQDVNLKESHNDVVQSLFDEKAAFPNLAEINIYGMDNLENIWHNQLAEGSFCELKTMIIVCCKKLVNIFPSMLLCRFQRLEKLTIRSCDSSEKIFDLPGLSVEGAHSLLVFQLKHLQLYNLPKLKHIWNKDPQRMLTFQNLHTLSASRCQVMKSLLPFSITSDLLQLEELEIVDCGVETIVADQENVVATPCFVFQRLTNLKIREIPKCRSFYPGMHTWECPMLKRLDMHNYDIVKIFTSEFLNNPEVQEEGQLNVPNQQPLVFFQKVIPNLEELLLNGEDTTTSTLWHCQFPGKFISTLKVLKLQYFNDKSIVFPFGFLQKLQNLEKLVVKDSFFKKIFSCEGLIDQEEHTGTLARLRNLEIDTVDELRHIWEQDHQLVPDPKNLESLKVWRCDNLVNLAPSTASFQNLTTLDVYKCKGLLYLITSSAAKSLVQLVDLEIDACDMMIEIVAKQGDKVEDEIIFSKLECLKILDLRNLTSFCSGDCTFNFPSLKEVIVEKCPRMRIFSPGELSTPKLHRVYWESDSKNKVRWDGSLNDTIGHLYTEMVGFIGLEDLKLSEFPQLKGKWHGELPIKFFSDLESLLVDECDFFSNAVPSKLLQSLNNLQNLEVRNCSSLEGVFDLEGLSVDQAHIELLSDLTELHLVDLPWLRHVWNKDPQGILDFTSLEFLEIHNCSNLRNIFTPSMALSLVQLEKMDIRNCAMLEEIITKERADKAAIEKIEFPVLETVTFKSLPNLTSFYSGNGILGFPSLKEITIENSPNMKTFFSSFLREHEHKTVDKGKGDNDIATVPLSNNEIALPNLKKLRVEWNDTMEVIRHGQFQAEFFSKLQVLELTCFPNDYSAFPSHFLQRFPNLESLLVSNASFEEIVLHEETDGEEKHARVLEQLRELELSKLPKLMHLSREDSQPCPVFQNLITLKVLECSGLKILVPFSVSFECLMTLEVSKCHRLINLMTSSTAKCLMQLTRLSITECEMIEHIIGKEENDAENEVIFHNLECLRLHCLPSLTSFYFGNCGLMFPSLEKVFVRECAKMEIFSEGITSTPKLKRVLLTEEEKQEEEDKGCWEGNLNATIQKLFMEMGQAMAQPKQPTSPKQPMFRNETTQAEKSRMLAVSEEPAFKDMHTAENPNASKNISEIESAICLNIKEKAIHGALTKADITQMASTYQDSHATSHYKEDPMQGQNSQIPMDIGTQISLQVRNDHQATNKDIQADSVIGGKDVPQNNLDDIDCSIEVTRLEEMSNTLDSTLIASASSRKTGLGKPLSIRYPPVTIDKELGDGDRSCDVAMERSNNDVDTKGCASAKKDRDEYDNVDDGALLDSAPKTFQPSLSKDSMSFNGFQVSDSFVPYLIHIQSLEGTFWDVGYKRKATVSYFLTSIGEVMALLDKQKWGALSKEELEFVANSIADALQAGFQVNCLRPMMERAKELLALDETQSRYEILMQELSTLESRIESLRANLGDLAGKLKSKEVISDMRCLSGFYG